MISTVYTEGVNGLWSVHELLVLSAYVSIYAHGRNINDGSCRIMCIERMTLRIFHKYQKAYIDIYKLQ